MSPIAHLVVTGAAHVRALAKLYTTNFESLCALVGLRTGSARSELCENGRCPSVAVGRKEPPSVIRGELFRSFNGGQS